MTGAPEHGGWKRIARASCPHAAWGEEGRRRASTGAADACEACGGAADLRLCLTCGFVGCCESHEGHDTEHFRASGHPVIRPHRCDYDFLWCYACNAFLD